MFYEAHPEEKQNKTKTNFLAELGLELKIDINLVVGTKRDAHDPY